MLINELLTISTMHFNSRNNRRKSKRQIILLLICLLFLIPYSSSLQITEIMFNPNGSDSGREWIELYNNDSHKINLSGMIFYEGGTNHKTEPINSTYIIQPEKYAIIVDKPSLFLEDYPHLNQSNTTDSNITIFDSSFSLRNSGEFIAIKINDTEITSLNYTIILQKISINEGFSLSLQNLTWQSSNCPGGSPGFPDCPNQSINLSNSTTNNQNSTPNSTQDPNLCDITIDIETAKLIVENKEQIKYKHRLTNTIDSKKYNYTIEYWIEDIFNSIIKKKRNTTNVNKKQWTPSIKEKLTIAFLKAIITPQCNDTNISNNYAETMIIIKHQEYEEEVEECDCKKECSQTKSSSTITYQTKPDIEYSIQNLPKTIMQNSTLSFNATITNNDNKEHEIRLHSYAYRGNKCISGNGNRTLNTIKFTIQPNNSKTIEMSNTISDTNPGEYKVKLAINKDRQKTSKQLIRQINVTAYIPQEDESNRITDCNCSAHTNLLNNAPTFYKNQNISATIIKQENQPNIIYKAKDLIIKDSIIYFILAFMAACIIIIVFSKKHAGLNTS